MIPTTTHVCPVCTTETGSKRDGTPYWTCPGCGVWFQDPTLELGSIAPAPVTPADVEANRLLARWLVDEVMGGQTRAVVDLGNHASELTAQLVALGCVFFTPSAERKFGLAVHVHSFSRATSPIREILRLRDLVPDDGAVFIRMADHTVAGFERDLTLAHFARAPFFHCLSSIAELCARTGCFTITRAQELLPGQRDLVLRPI